MGQRLRALDDRTRAFFGGPGLAVLAAFTAFFFVVPGVAKMSGLDVFGTAVVLAAVAVCLVGVGRLRRGREDR